MADICPYTCILEECPSPETIYVSRTDWMRHVRQVHARCWECIPCKTPGRMPLIFPSVAEFIHHIKKHHDDTIREDQYQTLLESAAVPAPTGLSSCPLCDEAGDADSEPLLNHILEHVHEFSVRSLPWPAAETEDNESRVRDYFSNNDYFDEGSNGQSSQLIVSDASDRTSAGLASLPSDGSFTPPTLYKVGWICGTTTEFIAASAFLDDRHEYLDQPAADDNNAYTLGRIGRHNVVIAAAPDGKYGLVNAATVARDMLRSFPDLAIALMVGIGGGAPSPAHDIRLGDIVVSLSAHGIGGGLQYDYGKTVQDEKFKITAQLNQLPQCLSRAIAALTVKHEMEGHDINGEIDHVLEGWPRLRKNFQKPDPNTDRLYISTYKHAGNEEQECTATCDVSQLALRPERSEEQDSPAIHYGTIASANQRIKDANLRDKLSAERDVLCFEMAAGGLMRNFPCLVIRGICNYSDTHKSKAWQGYAAMTAAAYAKDLLNMIAPKEIKAEKKISEVLEIVYVGLA